MRESLEKLIEVRNLSKEFHIDRKSILKAVDDISFSIYEGETFGLVGESGCGKTTLGRTILRLHPKTSGEVYFKGKEVFELNRSDLLSFKKQSQMIFQDPYSSLNPRMTNGDIISEGIDLHFNYKKDEKDSVITDLLNKVGLSSDYASRYPHELSGGQRQRIGIARALAVEPDFIVCDEPISALDVSIQAQIVNLLIELQEELGLTYLFISHDLSMVKHISDRIAVMYLGSIVELAPNKKIYNDPLHPYTQALLSSVPVPDPKIEVTRERIKLEGEIPSPINPPSGCKFRTRCRFAQSICAQKIPEFREVKKGHFVACHLV